MHQYKAVCAERFAVDAVLNSLFKHTWYLDSTLIPLALLDDGVALEEKKKIAAAILSLPKLPKSCYFKTENKQKEDKLLKIELNIHQQIPSLASLVDEFSWLMFDMIGIKDQRIDNWLTLPPQCWHTQSTYKLLLNFAKSIVCVNDHVERAIGMMQQFVHRYRDEEEKQNRLIAMDKVRSIFKASGSESLLTKKQNNKVRSKKRIAKGLLSLRSKIQKIA